MGISGCKEKIFLAAHPGPFPVIDCKRKIRAGRAGARMSFLSNGSIVTANTGMHSFSFLEGENLVQVRQITGLPGMGPHGLTVCKSRQFLYCANSYHRTITAVDCLKGKVRGSGSVGTTPCHLAYCRKNGCLYVTNFDSDSVSVVREKALEQIVGIPVGRMPHDILYSHWTGMIYIAVRGENRIAVVDPERNRVVDSIFLENAPLHFCDGESGRYLYVAGTDFGEGDGRGLRKFCCESLRRSESFRSRNSSHSEYGRTFGKISVVDLEKGQVADTISVGTYLTDVCVDEAAGVIFASDGGEGCVYVMRLFETHIRVEKCRNDRILMVKSDEWVSRASERFEEREKRRMKVTGRLELGRDSFPSCISYVKEEKMLLVGDHMSGKVMKFQENNKGNFRKIAESLSLKDLNHFLVL